MKFDVGWFENKMGCGFIGESSGNSSYNGLTYQLCASD